MFEIICFAYKRVNFFMMRLVLLILNNNITLHISFNY